MNANLYTIGYQGISPSEFLFRLKKNNVSLVADVRNLPLSRKKGFSKNQLLDFLNSQEIEYRNFNTLGIDKKLRNYLKETGDYKHFFQAAQDSIFKEKEELEELKNILEKGKNVALLCFEKDPELCHRKIVAKGINEISGQNIKIKHI